MKKITIPENGNFTCPMMSKTISERGDIKYAACAKCEYNALHQFVDNVVYCLYGTSSSDSDSVDQSQIYALSNKLDALEQKVETNEELDRQQQAQIDANTNTNAAQESAISNQEETIVNTVQTTVNNAITSPEMKETINVTIAQQVAEQTNPWESYSE